MECDWAAHTTALGTADAAKWVSRQKNRSTQPRATIGMCISTGRCGRPTAEAAERRLEAGVFAAFQRVATVDLWFRGVGIGNFPISVISGPHFFLKLGSY